MWVSRSLHADALRACTAIALVLVTGTAHAESGGMRHMLDAIRADFRDTASHTGIAAPTDAVMGAMREVARDEFVPSDRRHLAWFNRAMAIGHGQTISQPFIVALMTQLAAPEPQHRVLEIGTGSGYQAAVLARVVDTVYSIEIVPELATQARERLARLGVENVQVREGNGWLGWPEQAPFDAIVVTAGGPDVPPALLAQLAPGGRLVMPVGPYHGTQTLRTITRHDAGDFETEDILSVVFVPLTGEPEQPAD